MFRNFLLYDRLSIPLNYRYDFLTNLYLIFLRVANYKTKKCVYRIILKFSKTKEVKVNSENNFTEYCVLFNGNYETFKVIKTKKKAYKYEYKLRVKYKNLEFK